MVNLGTLVIPKGLAIFRELVDNFMLGKAFIGQILKGIQLGAIVSYINLGLDAS